MKIYYSPSNNAFYSDGSSYPALPDDLIEISEARWQDALTKQAEGKVISPGPDGLPVLLDQVVDYTAENIATAQSEYDHATSVINALNEQIQDEDYDGTTEEAVKAELTAWSNYRKELRAYIKAGDGSQMLPSSQSSSGYQ